ncbi:MAG: S24/S26 family peptidase [Paludibacteraceae bacterium]|nr:S24/S26 family peptidase [Paludibacteraceae bacterium]
MKVANDILIQELGRLLATGKEVRFTPSGVSMRPYIEGDKDSVILAPLKRAPRVGDIVLAEAETLCGNKTYVLHRLIRISNDLKQSQTTSNDVVYILQGDGNLAGEERCNAADIIGRVKRIESPKGHSKPLTRGYVWHFLFPVRKWLLKIYRHTILKWCYK